MGPPIRPYAQGVTVESALANDPARRRWTDAPGENKPALFRRMRAAWVSLLVLVERKKPEPAANPSDCLSDLPGTQQGGGSPLAGKRGNEAARCVEPKGMKKFSQDREDLSDFDILNIFRRCWFLSRDKLVANVTSAQKAEDGKFSWVGAETTVQEKARLSRKRKHAAKRERIHEEKGLPRHAAPLVISSATTSCASVLDAHDLHNAQGVNLWKLRLRQRQARLPRCSGASRRAPITARRSHSVQQRFWVNTRHYKPRPGAPVIVIDGGETSGEDRLPFLDTGIADILARATGSIGVVLEHTVGVTLNDEQALEDSANFIRNIKFEDIDEDLTAPNVDILWRSSALSGVPRGWSYHC
ncbi:hypothetical protein BJV78DRAFT_1357038 [Lactifluus subvellereus]|nr:hypothetical protein BJV78DRAFT_1357038 [Lactifluus subvellereus]